MQIRRTANAGVLLRIDGVSVLMDGVCGTVPPYLPTPATEMASLTKQWPDAMAFTHCHQDHLDLSATARFHLETGRPVIGTAELAKAMGESVVSIQNVTVNGLRIIPVPTKHIGLAGNRMDHVSYVLRGSSCVWFAGDASPFSLKACSDFGAPDVMILPFAYAATESAWQGVKRLMPKAVVLVHMPDPGNDPSGLWPMVRTVLSQQNDIPVWIPEIGESRIWDGTCWV